MRRSLQHHFKQRSAASLYQLLLHTDTEIVKLFLCPAQEAEGQAGVQLADADPAWLDCMVGLIWSSGCLGCVRVKEDDLILHIAKQVESMIRGASYHSQGGGESEAGLQPRDVDRVDLTQTKAEGDKQK